MEKDKNDNPELNKENLVISPHSKLRKIINISLNQFKVKKHKGKYFVNFLKKD